MLLVYLDESYRRGNAYWLAACAIQDARVADLCRGVADAAASIPTEFGIPADVEIHAQQLYHGDGDFTPLKKQIRVRVQAYRRGLEALTASAPAVFLIGVRWCDAAVEPRHPLTTHRLAALRHLLASLETYCIAHDERALIVADEEETTAADVVTIVRHHQHEQPAGQVSRILDGPLFTPSHWSYGVQACDLVAFLHTRRQFGRSDGKPENRRAQQQLDGWWSMLREHVCEQTCHEAPASIDATLADRLSRESAR